VEIELYKDKMRPTIDNTSYIARVCSPKHFASPMASYSMKTPYKILPLADLEI